MLDRIIAEKRVFVKSIFLFSAILIKAAKGHEETQRIMRSGTLSYIIGSGYIVTKAGYIMTEAGYITTGTGYILTA